MDDTMKKLLFVIRDCKELDEKSLKEVYSFNHEDKNVIIQSYNTAIAVLNDVLR